MRLYLSSYYFGNQTDDLIRIFGTEPKVALIYNACDFSEEPTRGEYLEKHLTLTRDLGWDVEELDLRHYFGHTEKLRSNLANFQGVWVPGGNAFILMRAMKQSGFDTILQERLAADTLAYGGFSAGAVVTAPTLKGLEIVDDPSIVPVGYSPEVPWEGFGLVDFTVVPHFDSPHPESALINDVVQYLIEHHMPYRTLHDGEAISIDGTQTKLIK